MFCSQCSYTSFDHLTRCPKCGYDWGAERRIFNVEWVQAPGDAWMLSSQDSENMEPEVSGEFVREEDRAKVSGSIFEEGVFYQSVKSHDREDDPLFSLDLGKELDSDAFKEPGPSRISTDAGMKDEIELPDLEISSPDSKEK